MQKEQQLELFRRYRRNPTPELKAEIIKTFTPLVRTVAMQIYMRRNLGNWFIDYDDMVSEGSIALLRSIDRFDPERGNYPSTFFSVRIFGGIIDSMRLANWVPRTAQKRMQKGEINDVSIYSLEQQIDDEHPIGFYISGKGPKPSSNLERDEFWDVATQWFSERERLMFVRYYRDGITMKQISKEVGVSESRVSQMMSRLIGFLRENRAERLKEILEAGE